jgi:hypothetical protein
MSENQPAQPSKSPPARNPVEKVIVYGLILVLLALVGVEAYGKFSQQSAYNSISTELKKADDDAKGAEVTEEFVKKVVGNRSPVQTKNYAASNTGTFAESKELEVYSWFTLNPYQKREIWVHYARKGVNEKGPAVVVDVSPDESRAPAVSDEPKPMAEGMPTLPPVRKLGPGNPGEGAAPARPAADKNDDDKKDEDKKDEEKKPEEKPAEEAKPETEKPAGEKPEGEKPAEAKPE